MTHLRMMRGTLQLLPYTGNPTATDVERKVEEALQAAVAAPVLSIGKLWDVAAVIGKFAVADGDPGADPA